jgi:hypothetical protein
MALGALAITPPVANTIVPVNFAGNAAAIQAPAFGEDTRVYYQADVSGGILELAFTGPATVGKAFSIQTLIPAAQVQPRTLIAAVITDGVDFTGVRLSVRLVIRGQLTHAPPDPRLLYLPRQYPQRVHQPGWRVDWWINLHDVH